MSETLWTAFALVLIFEGLLPFIAPGAWRRVFSELLQMQDGQIRFFGLICLCAGAIIGWFMN